jgi:hypothetical protein
VSKLQLIEAENLQKSDKIEFLKNHLKNDEIPVFWKKYRFQRIRFALKWETNACNRFWDRFYDRNFLRFSTIFVEQIGVFS